MQKCEQCGEEIEDQFDSCWRCAGQAQPARPVPALQERPVVRCLRCRENMEYCGNKRFYEGGHFAALMGNLFVNRESFDVYACPGCGHVEFFVEPLRAEDHGKV